MSRLEEIAFFTDHSDIVWSVCWSRDGKTLATTGVDKKISIGRASKRPCGSPLTRHASTHVNLYREATPGHWVLSDTIMTGFDRTIRAISWHPSNTRFAVGCFDQHVFVWEQREQDDGSLKWKMQGHIQGHQSEVKSVAYSPDGDYIASCGRDRNVFIWAEEDDDYDCVAHLTGHTQDVKHVTWHPHREALLSSSYDDTLRLWEVNEADHEWGCACTIPFTREGEDSSAEEKEKDKDRAAKTGHHSTVWMASFEKTTSDDEEPRIVSCSDDATVKVWQRRDGAKPVYELVASITEAHSRPIYAVDWCQSGLIATGAGDNAIALHAALPSPIGEDAKFETTFRLGEAHSSDVNCVAWNPAELSLLASCSDEGEVKIWRVVPQSP